MLLKLFGSMKLLRFLDISYNTRRTGFIKDLIKKHSAFSLQKGFKTNHIGKVCKFTDSDL